MEQISFPCQSCGKVLKVSADKAGRKAKCKCGAEVTIPAGGKAKATAGAAASRQVKAETPAPPPPPPPPPPVDDDEEGGTYGLIERPLSEAELEELEKDKNKGKGKSRKKDEDEDEDDDDEDDDDDDDDEDPAIKAAEEARRQRLRDMISLRKAPVNPKQWEKGRLGILLAGSGMCVMGLGWLMHFIFVILTMQAPMEYAYVASAELIVPDQVPIAGEPIQTNKARFLVALLTGADDVEVGLWLLRLTYIFNLVALIICAAGYGFCIGVPPRFGTRGLAIATLAVACLNIVITLFFKLLPVAGAMNYVMIPLVGPEVPMAEANLFRIDPIHITWSSAPFWESLMALIFHMLALADLVLFSIFLRACALSLRDEVLDQRSQTLIQLGLGTAFAQMAYLLIANAGTSDVLLSLLQIVYVLGLGFYTGTLAWFTWTLFWSRGRIARKLKGL